MNEPRITVNLSPEAAHAVALACHAAARAHSGTPDAARLLDVATHLGAALKVAGWPTEAASEIEEVAWAEN